MPYVDAPELNLRESYCHAWRDCLPEDFKAALSHEVSHLSGETEAKIEAASSDVSAIIDVVTSDEAKGISSTQAFMLMCWMAHQGEWNKVERLFDNEKVRETFNNVVKHAIGPRMAKAVVVRNIADLKAQPKKENTLSSPGMGV